MGALKDKRILFFTPFFFNYQNAIKQEMENEGAVVHMYDERNNPTDIEKILIRKASWAMRRKINKFYMSVVSDEKEFNPDYILFISPEAVTNSSLELIKKSFPSAKLILYMWDSIENKDIESGLQYFDELYSFDSNDCEKYGMKFRPLFYIHGTEKNEISEEYTYDVSFIGTVHSDRAHILFKVKDYCDKHGLKYFFYLYIPGGTMLFFRKLFTKDLKKWDSSFVHTTSLPKETIDDISSHTKCIIDINHPNQTGLTMRTIEMLGLRRKLITTNKNIVNYDFYRPENQILLDRETIDMSLDNIHADYVDIPDEIYEKYSLKYWLHEVFSDSKGE